MKKFKKVIAIALGVMAVSSMNIPALAVYNADYPDADVISQYGYHPWAPKGDEDFLDLTNYSFGDSMNGVSSANGNGYSDFWFRASNGDQIILNLGLVDTNGTSGTVTLTVRNKYDDNVVYGKDGKAMECAFVSDNDGFMPNNAIATFTFAEPTDFYIEIKTSDPLETRCYGTYYITKLDHVG